MLITDFMSSICYVQETYLLLFIEGLLVERNGKNLGIKCVTNKKQNKNVKIFNILVTFECVFPYFTCHLQTEVSN